MSMMKSTAKIGFKLKIKIAWLHQLWQIQDFPDEERQPQRWGRQTTIFLAIFSQNRQWHGCYKMLINKCWSLFQWKWPPQVPPSPQPSGPSPPRDAVESQQTSSLRWTPVAPSGGRTLTHNWDSSRTSSVCSTSPRRPPTSGSSPLARFPRTISSWTSSTQRKTWVPGLHYQIRGKLTLSRNTRQKCLVLSVLLLNNPKHTRQLSRKVINWLDCREHSTANVFQKLIPSSLHFAEVIWKIILLNNNSSYKNEIWENCLCVGSLIVSIIIIYLKFLFRSKIEKI